MIVIPGKLAVLDGDERDHRGFRTGPGPHPAGAGSSWLYEPAERLRGEGNTRFQLTKHLHGGGTGRAGTDRGGGFFCFLAGDDGQGCGTPKGKAGRTPGRGRPPAQTPDSVSRSREDAPAGRQDPSSGLGQAARQLDPARKTAPGGPDSPWRSGADPRPCTSGQGGRWGTRGPGFLEPAYNGFFANHAQHSFVRKKAST